MLSRMNFPCIATIGDFYCFGNWDLCWSLRFFLIVTSYTRISPLCSNPFCSRGFGVGFGCLNTESHRVFGAVGPFKGGFTCGNPSTSLR